MARTGEYVAIDLDENNRYTREEWAKRHPGQPQRSFGWGVCRMGHGLQDHGQHRGVVLTEATAREWADQLNATQRVSPWRPANNGVGKRIWFVYRDHPDVRERYRFSKNDRLIRYASAKAAQRAADRLNAASAT